MRKFALTRFYGFLATSAVLIAVEAFPHSNAACNLRVIDQPSLVVGASPGDQELNLAIAVGMLSDRQGMLVKLWPRKLLSNSGSRATWRPSLLEMRACHIAVLSSTHKPTTAARSEGGESDGRCWGQSAKNKRRAK